MKCLILLLFTHIKSIIKFLNQNKSTMKLVLLLITQSKLLAATSTKQLPAFKGPYFIIQRILRLESSMDLRYDSIRQQPCFQRSVQLHPLSGCLNTPSAHTHAGADQTKTKKNTNTLFVMCTKFHCNPSKTVQVVSVDQPHSRPPKPTPNDSHIPRSTFCYSGKTIKKIIVHFIKRKTTCKRAVICN